MCKISLYYDSSKGIWGFLTYFYWMKDQEDIVLERVLLNNQVLGYITMDFLYLFWVFIAAHFKDLD